MKRVKTNQALNRKLAKLVREWKEEATMCSYIAAALAPIGITKTPRTDALASTLERCAKELEELL